jgi:predicted metal-dependent hydrolase
MPDTILNGELFEYELNESKRASKMKLSVFPGGILRVTIPKGFPRELAERFMRKKSAWITAKIGIMKKRNHDPVFHRFSKKEYQKNKNQALALVKNKLEEFNRIYGFEYNKITIRNSRSRWGSCSAKKNLNFNYKILFLPEELLDYIVIHELCHLGEMNHSRRFWDLVGKTIPNYREMRKKMRKI